MEVRAKHGELRYGYQHAAALTAVHLVWEQDAKAWRLAATVQTSNAFRLSQRPLVFLLRHAKGVWRWPVQTLQMSDGELHATLGQREKPHGEALTVPGPAHG